MKDIKLAWWLAMVASLAGIPWGVPTAFSQESTEPVEQRVADLEYRVDRQKTNAELIQDLFDPHDDGWVIRQQAAKELGQRRVKEAASALALVGTLKNTSLSLKRLAIQSLAEIAAEHNEAFTQLQIVYEQSNDEKARDIARQELVEQGKGIPNQVESQPEPRKALGSQSSWQLTVSGLGGMIRMSSEAVLENSWAAGVLVQGGIFVWDGFELGLSVPFFVSKPEFAADPWWSVQLMPTVTYGFRWGTAVAPFAQLAGGMAIDNYSLGVAGSAEYTETKLSYAFMAQVGAKIMLADAQALTLGFLYDFSPIENAQLDNHRLQLVFGYTFGL